MYWTTIISIFSSNYLINDHSFSVLLCSPSSNLNSKKITSQDDLGNVVGVGQQTAPLPGLPATTGPRTTSAGLRDDASIASGSSGFGSLTKKKTNDILAAGELDPASFISSVVTDSGISESSEPLTISLTDSMSNQLASQPPNAAATQPQPNLMTQAGGANAEQGHSRNSSNTSQVSQVSHIISIYFCLRLSSVDPVFNCVTIFHFQMSKGSGYSSFSHSQHSRQSSEGDSGHTR